MSRHAYGAYAGVFGVAALLMGAGPAFSHVEVGKRLFPATLLIEDPGVMDELALPTFAYLTNPDGSRQYDISGEWSKRITPDFGFGIGDTFTFKNNPAARGWQNLEAGLKYQLFKSPEHEFMISTGVAFQWGRTGNASVGAERYTSWGPEIFFGKGFGDLPTSLNVLRPFAVTGQFGVEFSTHPIDVIVRQAGIGESLVEIEKNPTMFNWGFSLQYSLPYLNENVAKVGGPEFLKQLMPLVEVSFASPLANIPVGGHTTTGIVAPGVVYMSELFQIATEVLIPVNSASGKHIGAIAQLHFFLDELFPDSIGRPLFAPAGYAH